MKAVVEEVIMLGQSSISWMGFTHDIARGKDDETGMPLWNTVIELFMRLAHEGTMHSSISGDIHFAAIILLPMWQVNSVEKEKNLPCIVILVSSAERSVEEGINEITCADRTTKIWAIGVAQDWPQSPLNDTA
jgi:hypothetical protein